MARICLDFDEVEDDALPRVCMLCGQPATKTVSRNFSWCPGWVIVLIFVALVPYIIVSLILTKYCRVAVPTCDKHRGHWSRRFWFTLLTFLGYLLIVAGTIALIIYLDSRRPQQGSDVIGLLVVSVPALFIVWLIAVAITQYSTFSASEITDHDICFSNVAPAFASALEDLRDQRQERRRQRKRGVPPPDDVPEVRPVD